MSLEARVIVVGNTAKVENLPEGERPYLAFLDSEGTVYLVARDTAKEAKFVDVHDKMRVLEGRKLELRTAHPWRAFAYSLCGRGFSKFKRFLEEEYKPQFMALHKEESDLMVSDNIHMHSLYIGDAKDTVKPLEKIGVLKPHQFETSGDKEDGSWRVNIDFELADGQGGTVFLFSQNERCYWKENNIRGLKDFAHYKGTNRPVAEIAIDGIEQYNTGESVPWASMKL